MNRTKGLSAYLEEQAQYEKSGLSEPDALVDDFIEAAAAQGEVLQEKSTVKGLVGSDLRRQMPPQMFAVVSSMIKLIEKVDEQTRK